jgi:hypothetical protein
MHGFIASSVLATGFPVLWLELVAAAVVDKIMWLEGVWHFYVWCLAADADSNLLVMLLHCRVLIPVTVTFLMPVQPTAAGNPIFEWRSTALGTIGQLHA